MDQLMEYLNLYLQVHRYPPKWFTSIVTSNVPRELQYKFKNILDGKGDLADKFFELYNVASPGSTWNGNKTYEQRIVAASKKVGRDALGAKIFAKLSTLNSPVHFDFGSGDGTTALATSRVIRATKTYCSDVADYMLAENKEHCDFTIITATDDLKISDVDIVTASHVFHHLPSYELIQTRLNQIYSGLQKGGLLLIREHDIAITASNEIDARLKKYNQQVVLLMHLCYEVNEIPKGKSRDQFNAWFYGTNLCLMKKQELRRFAENAGFKFVADSIARPSDLSYYILFEKD